MAQPTLPQLRALVAVAEEGSVSGAARRLGQAQPPVSRALAALERALGVTLLERGARGVTLTPAGRAVLPHARAALREVDRVTATAGEAAAGRAGRVRVGLVRPAFGLLAGALAVLREEKPGIEVVLEPSTTAKLLARLADGGVDLALVAAPFPAAGLRTVPLGTIELLAALPPAHPLAGRAAVRLADLREDPWVTLPDLRVGLAAHLVAACRGSGFYPVVDARAEEVGAILALVAAGRGVTLVPREEVVEHLPVAYVPLDGGAPVEIVLAWPAGADHAARDAIVALLAR